MAAKAAADDATLRVSVYQGASVSGDIAANLAVIEKQAAAAAEQRSSLVLFPELFLSGYDIGHEAMKRCARSVDSEDIAAIGLIAKRHRIAVCCSYPQKGDGDDQKYYIAAVLFDAKGRRVTNYRKTHVWGDENKFFTRGAADQLAAVDLDLLTYPDNWVTIKVGILICFDIEFPEPPRIHFLQGVQLLLVPTALGKGPGARLVPYGVVPTRASENLYFIAYSNLSASVNAEAAAEATRINPFHIEMAGSSAIVSVTGADLARAGESDSVLLTATLNREEAKQYEVRNPFRADRRPDVYEYWRQRLGDGQLAANVDMKDNEADAKAEQSKDRQRRPTAASKRKPANQPADSSAKSAAGSSSRSTRASKRQKTESADS